MGLVVAFALLTLGIAVAPASAASDPITGFRLPFLSGDSHKVTQGWNTTYSHNGLSAYAYDFGMPIGTPVVAAARGVVKWVENRYSACGGQELAAKANHVVLNHDDGTATTYVHLSRVDVVLGQLVAPGQQIGLSGDVGWTSCGPHLHFARQAQSSTTYATQSQKVYFEEYPGVQFVATQVVKSGNPACSQSSSGMPSNAFCGKYFKGQFSGPEYFSRIDPAVNFDWGTGAPGGYWLNNTVDNFSARWVGRFTFSSTATYYFFATASDGLRVYVDGIQVFQNWNLHTTPADYQFTRYISAGSHELKVEYYEATGPAVAQLRWSTSPAN